MSIYEKFVSTESILSAYDELIEAIDAYYKAKTLLIEGKDTIDRLEANVVNIEEWKALTNDKTRKAWMLSTYADSYANLRKLEIGVIEFEAKLEIAKRNVEKATLFSKLYIANLPIDRED